MGGFGDRAIPFPGREKDRASGSAGDDAPDGGRLVNAMRREEGAGASLAPPKKNP